MNDDHDPPAGSPPQSLPRVLGPIDGIGMVIGSIIGSGIFLKVGNVTAALEPFGFGPIIGVWIFVGLITLCGSLALAELAAMYPHAGGPFLYLRAAFGQLPAFLWGWTEFWVVRTGSVGALACATALYLDKVVPLGHLGQELVSIGIVVALSIAGILSTKGAAAIQNVFTAAKLLFLAALIVLPFAMFRADLSLWQPVWQSASETSFWRALGIAFVAVMWPYDGWINVGPVAEDLKDPQRNVPRALGIGLTVVVLVYVLANLSYHAVLPMAAIAKTQTVAADVFDVLFGPVGITIASIGVMCSTFGATNSNMLCGPRIYLAMARDGLLPGRLHHIHERWQTPANAIIVQAIWTILLMVVFYAWKDDPKGAFDGLTDSVIFAGLIFYSLTVAAVYVLRWTQPQRERPYKVWGYPWTPALLIGAYAYTFVSLLIEQWQQTTGVLLLIGAGVVYYVWVTRFARRS
jgi:APA family basic amino acid/polyamine antiporter